ncbi:peptidoglycan-binding protein [Chitinimonas naiadis]
MINQFSTKEEIIKLQRALLDAGFPPGAADGIFGEGTRAALMAFQLSRQLLADGIAGPITLSALGLIPTTPLPSIAGVVNVQIVAQMFPGTPLGNISTHLPIVLAALARYGLQDKVMTLAALATIRAETASFRPITEGISRFNTSPNGHHFDLYDNRKDLGNRGAPDGASFAGRGFIQLTGRANYTHYGPKLNPPVDLVSNPEAANDPDTAASLLALFLKDHALAIKTAILQGDFKAARRQVNGGTHGWEDFQSAYQTGARLLS